ncbi:MAG: hypothetical protein K2H45_01310 [Acetatifactor sp.]|nr:hypothetical protein [Acetatifactor sp.]
MRRFRNITVDHVEYKWLFRYDDYDYINFPYLLIVTKSSPETTLRIVFPIKEHFLLNSGFPAVFHGQQVSINLNRPFFVSQIIQWYGKQEGLFIQAGYQSLNGLDILKAIGYEVSNGIFTI